MAGRLCVSLLVICFAFLAGCTPQPYPYISLSPPGMKTAEDILEGNPPDKPLRVALASIISAAENQFYYDELLSYLSRQVGLPVRIIQRNTYAEVNVLLRAGLVDAAILCSYSYVAGHDQFGLELVAVPQVAGKTTYNSYLIVRQDEGIRKLADLKGRSFAFTDPMSTSGYFYPVARLIESGHTPDNFFGSYMFTYSHDNSIRAVAEEVADGAAVDSLVFDYLKERRPRAVQNLELLEVSPAYSAPPVVVRPDLKPELKEKIRQAFLSMGEDKVGQMILTKLRVEAYVPIDDAAYESVRQLRRAVIRSGSARGED